MAAKMDSWAVAAAILQRSKYALHYTDLTDRVRASGLTTLGERGDTPEKTLRSTLSTMKVKGVEVFEKQGQGYYALADRGWTEGLKEVRKALERLDGRTPRDATADAHELVDLQTENSRLRKKIGVLEKKLASIRAICG